MLFFFVYSTAFWNQLFFLKLNEIYLTQISFEIIFQYLFNLSMDFLGDISNVVVKYGMLYFFDISADFKSLI